MTEKLAEKKTTILWLIKYGATFVGVQSSSDPLEFFLRRVNTVFRRVRRLSTSQLNNLTGSLAISGFLSLIFHSSPIVPPIITIHLFFLSSYTYIYNIIYNCLAPEKILTFFSILLLHFCRMENCGNVSRIDRSVLSFHTYTVHISLLGHL